MKSRLFAAVLASLSLFASCGLVDFDDTLLEEEEDILPILDGNTFTYGDHQYVLDRTDDGATVTFTHFPGSVREFKFLQTQLLGISQPGTLALNLMAFEMFRRDRTKGQKCIELCNLSVNAKSIVSNLREKFPEQRDLENDTDSYHQPYLVASFLKGATQENKYQPDYPYQLSFTYSTSPYDKQGEYSYSFFGRIYYWMTTRAGNKDVKASVILLDDDEIVLVHACSNYYLAAPPVSSWNDTLK